MAGQNRVYIIYYTIITKYIVYNIKLYVCIYKTKYINTACPVCIMKLEYACFYSCLKSRIVIFTNKTLQQKAVT